jgi:hypothetical protein
VEIQSGSPTHQVWEFPQKIENNNGNNGNNGNTSNTSNNNNYNSELFHNIFARLFLFFATVCL